MQNQQNPVATEEVDASRSEPTPMEAQAPAEENQAETAGAEDASEAQGSTEAPGDDASAAETAAEGESIA